jgi:hypothetical protein
MHSTNTSNWPPQIVGGILTQAEGHVARLAAGDDFARGVPDFGFDAATADGADHRAVFANEEFGAFKTGDRAADLDDGGEGALLAQSAHVDQFVENVHVLLNYSG